MDEFHFGKIFHLTLDQAHKSMEQLIQELL